MPATLDEDLARLRQIHQALEDAENGGDVDHIASLLAADCVLMAPNFPVQEGGAACAAFVREVLGCLVAAFDRRISYVSAAIEVTGDLAVDRGTFAFTIAPKNGGRETRESGKYLWLYTRANDGAWQLSRVIIALDDHGEPDEPAAARRSSWREAPPRLALPFAAFLAVSEVVRNWGDWGWWPIWGVVYVAVALLGAGWHASRREAAGAAAVVAGAWGFTCAMFYMTFVMRLATPAVPEHGPIAAAPLTIIIGALLVVAAAMFTASLVAVGRNQPIE